MSSISGASASGSTQQTQWNQAQNPFQQLSQALASGNLSAAQSAFTQIQQNAPQGASAQGGQSGTSPFAALGQALQSGNLSAAQSAFSQLQQAHPSGGHHHHRGSGGGAEATAASTATTGTTGTTLNVTA
jgi:outer membrane protein assembly factor BamD (BamD/ComL family)